MYEKINVKIKSITPNDKYSTVGKTGFIYKGGTEIGNRLYIEFPDGCLKTSSIQSVSETANEIEVKTMNSVYTLEKIKEEK